MKSPPPERHFVSCRFEKVIASYEFELEPWMSDLAAKNKYSSIFNIGAAKGSSAIGLARRFPGIPVFAFEPDRKKVKVMRDLAKLSGVEAQLTIGVWCDPKAFEAIDPGDRRDRIRRRGVSGSEDIVAPRRIVGNAGRWKTSNWCSTTFLWWRCGRWWRGNREDYRACPERGVGVFVSLCPL